MLSEPGSSLLLYIFPFENRGDGARPDGDGAGPDPPVSVHSWDRLKVIGASVKVPVSCSGGSRSICKATATLAIVAKVRGHSVVALTGATSASKLKAVVLGRATVWLDTGESRTLRITLSGMGKRLVAEYHRLKVKLTITDLGRPVFVRTITLT